MKLVKKSEYTYNRAEAVVEAYSSEESWEAVDFLVSHLPNVHGDWPAI